MLRIMFAALLLALSTPAAAQTSADVVDRPTLRAFVERAAAHAESRVSDAAGAYAFFDRTFRPVGEWRHESIYLFVMTQAGVNVFHATRPDIEGQDRSGRQDKNGLLYIQALLREAAAGGGFVEYYFDNPAIQGDEIDGSRKIAYAAPLDVGDGLVVVSGFYPASAAPVLPPLALLALAALLAGGARAARRR